ncbi:FKBP-type peptidyl-prolyl cis-trans isomerase [Paraliomyxa miuraensis]|uniref:FKBP-type peptidyl-prolyl cis-trans isomerase n=1 Tax=Paraliomyxa miuraensis TaxID=376150 RepID=UPI00225A2021|nr:FKBP-type peptidyl-prolyl cis-trans isomerase [Paraliomyxa miuraensis]MCX4239578.1 FKBP-type peptidyl-prolyl cis-trans isomerase [Paraliomyxa miuraensis]
MGSSPALAALGSCMVIGAVVSCHPPPPASSPAPREAPPPPAAGAPASVPDVPARPPASALTTASGVIVDVLEPGDPSGPQPHTGDELELRYRVWDEAGRLVGESRPGRTERLSTTWLPRGWAEAMLMLHVGAHAHVWIPAAQAYESQPDGPQGDLRVDVWLVSLESTATPAERVPLMPPPDQALRTTTGLRFLVLRSGTGLRHPAPDARVTVHYEGWTADGARFDSSYERGKPTTFPLTAVISGWQEAVPLMVEGEKTRFWIPEELAYGHEKGRPQGMLIFDIELLRIEE